MKLTNTPSVKSKAGMTLLELTVVILVLLSLISILFIGARAWKKGSDRATNILNIRNVQQAVRGHGNLNSVRQGTVAPAFVGDPVLNVDIFGAAGNGVGAYLARPGTIATVTYDPTVNPRNGIPGELYLNPSNDGQPAATATAADAAARPYGPAFGTCVDW